MCIALTSENKHNYGMFTSLPFISNVILWTIYPSVAIGCQIYSSTFALYMKRWSEYDARSLLTRVQCFLFMQLYQQKKFVGCMYFRQLFFFVGSCIFKASRRHYHFIKLYLTCPEAMNYNAFHSSKKKNKNRDNKRNENMYFDSFGGKQVACNNNTLWAYLHCVLLQWHMKACRYMYIHMFLANVVSHNNGNLVTKNMNNIFRNATFI